MGGSGGVSHDVPIGRATAYSTPSYLARIWHVFHIHSWHRGTRRSPVVTGKGLDLSGCIWQVTRRAGRSGAAGKATSYVVLDVRRPSAARV